MCTTNPTLGRGLGLALSGAVDLVDTIDGHGDDRTRQALAMDALAAEHVQAFYEDQAAIDAARLAALRHTIFDAPAPSPPPAQSDRVTFAQLRAAAMFDAAAFRALWKVMGMIGRPDQVYRDPQIVTRTHQVLREHGSLPPIVQPTRGQLLAALMM